MNKLNYVSAQQSPDDSARAKSRSTAGVVIARLLAVLVVAMVLTAIVGFVVFDGQTGNSATAVATLVIGCFAAVLGLILGFLKAYLTS